jgi:succinate dehydrogenase/fumarate reductase flavoprotein subunit
MSVKNIADDVIETDILVVGGGIGGAFAALYASEQGVRVTLLEKADTRRSGSTGMGIGGWHQLMGTGVTLKDIAEDISNCGMKYIGTRNLSPMNKGLVDENLIYLGYKDNWDVVHTLEKWGLNMKWDDGQYRSPRTDNLRFHGRDIKKVIARALKKSPVTMLERTMGVDLLTDGDRVIGATALNVRTGEFLLCKAKATVLATGTISRIFNPWHQMSPGKFKMLYHYHAGSGDGAAMAFRAGAELVNMEVPGIGAGVKGTRLADKLPLSHEPALPGTVYNARGEKLEIPFDVDVQIRMEREGKGPFFADVTHLPDQFHEELASRTEDSLPIQLKFARERGLDTRRDKFEVAPFRPESNATFSGVLMGEDGQTTVKSLYAVGDMAGGSTFLGAANAAVFGMRAGKHAAAAIAKMKPADINEGQLAQQRETLFAPKERKRGVEPLEVEMKIRDIVERYCGPERSQGSIDQGLWRLRSVRDRFLPELTARDNHELMSCQEVRNLFLLAEVYMLCSRTREESGMRTFRLDHPDKYSVPWKEASIARLENGKITISRRKLPELRAEFRSR